MCTITCVELNHVHNYTYTHAYRHCSAKNNIHLYVGDLHEKNRCEDEQKHHRSHHQPHLNDLHIHNTREEHTGSLSQWKKKLAVTIISLLLSISHNTIVYTRIPTV